MIALLAANVLLAALAWKLWSARASAPSAEAASPAIQDVRREPAPPTPIGTDGPSRPSRSSGALANARDEALEQRVEAKIRSAIARAERETKGKLHGADVTVAVHVRELAVPGELVDLRAGKALRPASNMKLVTTAAALVLLGPDWSFETTLETDAEIVAGHVKGDVVVRAAGDPLYDATRDEGDGAGEVEHLLAPAIAELAKQGIVAIDGALVLDEGDFQAPGPGPAWPTEKDRWKEYCALAGGFSANAGCLTASVRATPGANAVVDVRPRAHGLPEKLGVRMGAAKSALDVRVGALNGTAIVEGSMPRDVSEWTTRFAVADPVELFGRALAGALRARHVVVKGGVVRERRASTPSTRTLARIATPLANVLTPINTHSNNACADQLFLALGHATGGGGTRAGGRAAVARALEALGLPSNGFEQVDGSGLSRDNRVSARQITALVDAVLRRDPRTAKLYLDSLAVGHESGTLDGRMKDPDLAGRVHAKTGFINGTSALSGIVDAPDGRTLVFSILVDYPPMGGLNQSCWKPMQDSICAELAGADG